MKRLFTLLLIFITACSGAPATLYPTSPPKTPTAAPSPISLSGIGDSVVDLDKWNGPALAAIGYTGNSNFIVWNYDSSNEEIDLLVNTIGAYKGVRLIDVDSQTARFAISATGAWTIKIYPLTRAYMRFELVPGTYKGVGDDVIFLDTNPNKPDKLIAKATGKSNFIVYSHDQSERDLLINEIAPYNGTVLLSNSAFAIEIKATGPWTLEVTSK